MTLLEKLADTQGITIHDYYSERSFEIISKSENWYFIGYDNLDRIEVATKHCGDKVYFNTVDEAYNYIIKL